MTHHDFYRFKPVFSSGPTFIVAASGLVSHPTHSEMVSSADFTTRALRTRAIHHVKLLVTLRCDPCKSSLRRTYLIVPSSATTEWFQLLGDGLVRLCSTTSGIPRRKRRGLTCPAIK